MLGDQAGEHAVHDPFGNLAAVFQQDRRVGHQVTDVADEQQRAAVQLQLAAVGRAVFAVRIQAADEARAALGHFLAEGTLHDAQPVAVGQHLVVGIHRGDRIFAVENGGNRGLDQQVLHAGGIGLADRAVRVDLDLDVQAVVLQQHGLRLDRFALEADELLWLLEAGDTAVLQGDLQLAVLHAIGGGVGVAAFGQRRGLIEEGARIGDDLGATDFVVARALLRTALFGDGVGAVERIVQRAPAGVGGVQRIARVHDRHHQLRSGLGGDLAIDVGRLDLHLTRHRQQVADGLEEGAVGRHVLDRARVGLVPAVQLDLHAIALGKQLTVLRCQVVDQGVQPLPEGGGFDTGARQDFVFDESLQIGRDLQAAQGYTLGHLSFSLSVQLARAATPALAIWASCAAVTPETPTEPMTWPSTTTGTPPSSEQTTGAERKAVRPLLTMSS